MGVFVSLGSLGFALGPLIAALIVQNLGLDKMFYTSFLGLFLASVMFLFVPKLSKIEKKPEYKNFIASFKEINKKTSNKTLRKDIEGNNEEMLNIVKRYFH